MADWEQIDNYLSRIGLDAEEVGWWLGILPHRNGLAVRHWAPLGEGSTTLMGPRLTAPPARLGTLSPNMITTGQGVDQLMPWRSADEQTEPRWGRRLQRLGRFPLALRASTDLSAGAPAVSYFGGDARAGLSSRGGLASGESAPRAALRAELLGADFLQYDPSAGERWNLGVRIGPQLQGWKRLSDVAGQIAAPGVEWRGRGTPGYDYRYDLRRLRARAEEGQAEAKPQRRVQQPQQPLRVSEDDKRKLGAVGYSEKTTGTLDEHAAIVSVVLNRVKSGDRQYVTKGQQVTIDNVVNSTSPTKQIRGKGDPNYKDFYDGTVSSQGAKNAARAVNRVLKNGATTDATFFIVNPGGKPPTEKEVHALGKVEPANPARIGDVYLYKPKGAVKRK